MKKIIYLFMIVLCSCSSEVIECGEITTIIEHGTYYQYVVKYENRQDTFTEIHRGGKIKKGKVCR